MKGIKIATRFSQSLLELSKEKGCEDAVMRDMEFLIKTAQENTNFQVFLNNPTIDAAKKNAILAKVFEPFDAVTLSFIDLVTVKGRENLLTSIAFSFIEKLKASRGIIPVTLTSARKLDESVKNDILAKLQGQIQGQFEVTEKIDENLIGGFVFRMGDTQIDASVARQFKNLKQSLTK
jgi:F-type H+-transporting ATPase subunit delta